MDYDEYNALKDPRIKKYVVQDRELPSTLMTFPIQKQNLGKALSALQYRYCQLLALSSSLVICMFPVSDIGFRFMTTSLLLCSYKGVPAGEYPPGTFCLSASRHLELFTGFIRALEFLRICAVWAGRLDDGHRAADAPSRKDVVDQNRGNRLRVSSLPPPLPQAFCKPVPQALCKPVLQAFCKPVLSGCYFASPNNGLY